MTTWRAITILEVIRWGMGMGKKGWEPLSWSMVVIPVLLILENVLFPLLM